jgi:hypothetical protein
MMVGILPFTVDGPVSATHNQILDHIRTLEIPANLSAQAISLLKGLLSDDDSRLTFKAIAAHPFFAEIDWDTLRDTAPPWIPPVTGPTDTTYFAPQWSTADASTQQHKPIAVAPIKQLECVGFSAASSETVEAYAMAPNARLQAGLDDALHKHAVVSNDNKMLSLKLQKVEGIVADLTRNHKAVNSERLKVEKESLNQSFEYHRRLMKSGGVGVAGTPLAHNRSMLNRSMLSMMSPRAMTRSAVHGSPGGSAPKFMMTPIKTPFKMHLLVGQSSPLVGPGTPGQSTAPTEEERELAGEEAPTDPAILALEAEMRATDKKMAELQKLYATEQARTTQLEEVLKEGNRSASRPSSPSPEDYLALLATSEANGAEYEAKFEEAAEILNFQADQIKELQSQLAIHQNGASDMTPATAEVQAEMHKLAMLNCELQEAAMTNDLDRLQLHLDNEYANIERAEAEESVQRSHREIQRLEQLAQNMPVHFEHMRRTQAAEHAGQLDAVLKQKHQLEVKSLQQAKLIDMLRVQLPQPGQTKRQFKKVAKARAKSEAASTAAAARMLKAGMTRTPLAPKATNIPTAAEFSSPATKQQGSAVTAPHRLQGVKQHPDGPNGKCSLCDLCIGTTKSTRNGVNAMRCMLCEQVFHKSCMSKLPTQCSVALPFTPFKSEQDPVASPQTPLEVLRPTERTVMKSPLTASINPVAVADCVVDDDSNYLAVATLFQPIKDAYGSPQDGWMEASFGEAESVGVDVLVSVARGRFEVFQSSDGIAYEPPARAMDPRTDSVIVKDLDANSKIAPWIGSADRARGFSVSLSAQCWPEHTICFLAPSVSSKNRWVAAIIGLGGEHANSAGRVVASLEQQEVGSINTVHTFPGNTAEESLAILGTDNGLYVMRGNVIHQVTSESPGGNVCEVAEIHCMDQTNDEFLLVVGAARTLVRCTFRGLRTGKTPVYTTCKWGGEDELVDLCQIATGVVEGSTFLVAVTSTTISVYEKQQPAALQGRESSAPTFVKVHAAEKDKVGVLQFLNGGSFEGGRPHFVWGDRTFWSLEPSKSNAAILPNQSDFGAKYCGGSSSLFAMAVFELPGDELLLCFNECGIFTHRDGAASRGGQLLEWSNGPSAFAMVGDCLYLMSWGMVELIDLRAGKPSRRVLTIPGVRLLGSSATEVLVSSSAEGSVQIISLDYIEPTQKRTASSGAGIGAGNGRAGGGGPTATYEYGQLSGSVPHCAITLASPFRELSVGSAC